MSVQKVFSHVLWKIEILKTQGRRDIGQWCLSHPSKEATWDLTQFSQLSSAAPSYFPESHWWSEISSLSKVILVLGRASSCRAPNLGCSRVESPGWFDVSQKICIRHDARVGVLSWWSCEAPVAHGSLLNHLNSFCGGMFKLHTKFDADSLLYLLSHF